MTDRLKGFVVVLDQDIREDDAECILNAIGLIKHVANVTPVKANIDDSINRERLRIELLRDVYDLIDKKLKP